MKAYPLRMEDDLMKRLKIHCVENDVSIKNFLIKLIEKELDEQKKTDD